MALKQQARRLFPGQRTLRKEGVGSALPEAGVHGSHPGLKPGALKVLIALSRVGQLILGPSRLTDMAQLESYLEPSYCGQYK